MTGMKANMCDVENETPNCGAADDEQCTFYKPYGGKGECCVWKPYDDVGISKEGALCCCMPAIRDAVLTALETKEEGVDVL